MKELAQKFEKLKQQYIENRYNHLNPAQRNAVLAVTGPLLILAGAGSGKTTVLINRIANMCEFGNAYEEPADEAFITEALCKELAAAIDENGQLAAPLKKVLAPHPILPYNILAITFTNKAAGELKTRLEKRLGSAGQMVNASTFHSACVRILRRDADKLGYPKSFTIYDSDDQRRIMREIYKALNIDDKFITPRETISRIGRYKDEMVSAGEVSGADVRTEYIRKIYVEYQRRLFAAGAMDFDDLIYNTVKLFEREKDVLNYYINLYKYILVDEYQDTSHAQFRLVKLLSAHKNLCVVGDDDQSIYRFRGATIENILGFEQTFGGTKVIKLEQNYRSTAHILNAANNVIQNNFGRKGKELWTQAGEGEKVLVFEAESEQDEASNIARTIEQNIESGAKLADHAVLYRMNAQSNAVETLFSRSGIPYKVVGGLRFFDRKEIKDIISYMSVVVNPNDSLRLKRIINEPSRKIGAATIEALEVVADGLAISMLEAAAGAQNYASLQRASKQLMQFYALYERMCEAHEQLPLDDFCDAVINISGYRTMLEQAGEEGLTRLENIQELVSSVKNYMSEAGPEATLEGFLEQVALISDLDNYDGEADAVTLMTLHAAKGLEFDHVFMVGMEEGVFPSDIAKYSPEDIEEERRLCYVGITRAKKTLTMSRAYYRMLFGQTKRNVASRFLNELSGEDIELKSNKRDTYLDGDYNRVRAGESFTRGTGDADGFLKYETPRNNERVQRYTGKQPPSVKSASTLNAGQATQRNTQAFDVGDTVSHSVFGEGTVLSVTPVANDRLVQIEFKKPHGIKKVMANFAALKKADQ